MVRFLSGIFSFVTVCALCIGAYSQTPAAGVVHPSVAVKAEPSNSYALYLPSYYSPARRWPLLLVFDPFARGEVAAKLFHDGAEKYGFIVVGSNNSRNFEDPSNAIRLLWADVKERYAVDARRIYVAGLSGGARVASAIALACKSCIAGVIACGAGLPQGAGVPGAEVADWFLAAGTTDFNYPEQLKLNEALEANHAAVRFVAFDGPHGWMPPDVAAQALAWMQLRAMVKGLTAIDRDLAGREYDSRMADAQAAQKNGDILTAARAYREIASDFRGLRDVKEVEARARALIESEAYHKARKNEKTMLELQDQVAGRIGQLVTGISEASSENRSSFITQLDSVVNDIHRDQRESREQARKQAISRGLASAFAYAAETGQQAMLKKDYFSAKEMFAAAETILPESSWASYLTATADARLGEKKQAIEELKKACDKGMTNAKALDDSAFDRLRGDEEFKELAEKLAGQAK